MYRQIIEKSFRILYINRSLSCRYVINRELCAHTYTSHSFRTTFIIETTFDVETTINVNKHLTTFHSQKISSSITNYIKYNNKRINSILL